MVRRRVPQRRDPRGRLVAEGPGPAESVWHPSLIAAIAAKYADPQKAGTPPGVSTEASFPAAGSPGRLGGACRGASRWRGQCWLVCVWMCVSYRYQMLGVSAIA